LLAGVVDRVWLRSVGWFAAFGWRAARLSGLSACGLAGVSLARGLAWLCSDHFFVCLRGTARPVRPERSARGAAEAVLAGREQRTPTGESAPRCHHALRRVYLRSYRTANMHARPRRSETGECYSMMSVTTPEPTVRPPSRMAKRRPWSMAIG